MQIDDVTYRFPQVKSELQAQKSSDEVDWYTVATRDYNIPHN